MLINRLHHPLLHDAARMWAVNVNIAAGSLILEANTRARRSTLLMFRIAIIAVLCLLLGYSFLRARNAGNDLLALRP